MSIYKGISFPVMFSKGGSTSIVYDLDKIRADLNLLLRTELNSQVMRPGVGIDFDAILFAHDTKITRDFVYTFVNNLLGSSMPDVSLKDVFVEAKDSSLYVSLMFSYSVGKVDFSMGYMLEDLIYGQ